ncbi:MAG TPA: hypothetical protein VL400_10635, partial [Polyangiaceae bacterium]|nr:hypothetical protein [Polyangiaceae bacterium]
MSLAAARPDASAEPRFFVELPGTQASGPYGHADVAAGLATGRYPATIRVKLERGLPIWLAPSAFVALAAATDAADAPEPPATQGEGSASPDLLMAPASVLDTLRFFVFQGDALTGPHPGREVRDGFEGGALRAARIALVGTHEWIAARKLFDRTLTDGARARPTPSAPDLKSVRCPTCRELIDASLEICPECDEPTASAAPASRGSIADDPEGTTWLGMHWRPLVTLGAIMTMILAGITLRYLAPGRFQVEEPGASTPKAKAAETCDPACWMGESCQGTACVWQKPAGAGHLGSRPGIAGPFSLPADVTDAILVDDERFAVGLLSGVEIRSTRTGQATGLVSEAPQTRRLVRAQDAIYAVGPQHIAVLDGGTLRLQKTLELGAIVGGVEVGVGGRRAFVSLPGAHAIAILSTEVHAELDRIRFGDDEVGPVGVDDAGKHALTTTGATPIAGLPDREGGAVYAFDPSRLATAQDRVRASMLGNPADVLVAPDGRDAWIVLRAKNAIVPLEWLPSGAVRQKDAIDTCDQPEQLALIRKARRAVVRCNRGRAVEIFDLDTGAVVRHVPFNGPATDMVVSPDGEQLVVTLPSTQDGALGIVDLTSFEVEVVPLTEPPSRLRASADGRSVLVLSDRSKVA